MNLILCGMPRSGKTYLGRKAALKLGVRFIDVDEAIMEAYTHHYGITKSCREIFLDHGSDFFRAIEKDILGLISGTRESLIALGGGTIGDPLNRNVIKNLGIVVYIKVSIETIAARMAQTESWPVFIDKHNPIDSLGKLEMERSRVYREISQWTIDGESLGEEEIVNQLILLYKNSDQRHVKQ